LGAVAIAPFGIKIIYEDIKNDDNFIKAHKLIKEAEGICFLGFGYHSINIVPKLS